MKFRFKTNAAITFILLIFSFGCTTKGEMKDNTLGNFQKQMEQRIPEWMERYEVPGVTLAVISKGEISWINAYGLADISSQTPMRPETVCRVESISKSVTARGVLKLVELGKIELDDPVYMHLHSWEFPQSDVNVEKVTIRHLLSHSSGLHLGTIGLEYAPGQEKPSLREALTREVQFVQEPGTSFIYSNVGFNLLELLIEDVSGRSFDDFMKAEVLIPSEMQTASFEWRDDFPTAVPNGYTLSGEPVPVYVYSEKGAGGLFANAGSVARFVASGMLNDFYKTGNTLSQNSIRELYTPVTDMVGIYSFVADQYGLGHFIETLPEGRRAVFGGGQGHGWMTHFHLVPDDGEGIVILTNSSRSWPLISRILSDWSDWNGFGSPGMEVITKATTVFWILIVLIMAGGLFCLGRLILDVSGGKRRPDFRFQVNSGVGFIHVALFVLLASGLTWSLTRDYLIITSVFPVASVWFFAAVTMVAIVFLIMALLPMAEHTPEKDLKRFINDAGN